MLYQEHLKVIFSADYKFNYLIISHGVFIWQDCPRTFSQASTEEAERCTCLKFLWLKKKNDQRCKRGGQGENVQDKRPADFLQMW